MIYRHQNCRAAQEGARASARHTISIHITISPWNLEDIFLNVAKNTTCARPRKGEAQGVLSYQKATRIFDNPHIVCSILHVCMYCVFLVGRICSNVVFYT